MVEKRIDPEDGQAYTYEEMTAFYKGQYKKKAMDAYWETCKVAKGKKGKGKGKEPASREASPKAKAKAKAKVSAVAKVKAKAKAKKPAAKAASNFKVCVIGGAGGIGQPLSMFMALDSNVSEVSVVDLNVAMVPPAGVAADLGHLEKKSKVVGYVYNVGEKAVDKLEAALTGCHVVLIPAGLPRKPGMTRDDLFKTNADIAKGLVSACAKFCPEAILLMIVNPVNSVVPAMCELYKKKGLDHKKIVGVTTLDIVRANKFVGEITGKNPGFINVPVIGGHAGVTIMPVFSQDKVSRTIESEKIPDLDKRVQDAGTEVVEAKGGKGSATLSMAYAGARMARSVLAGLSGKRRTECAYVASDVMEGFEYFSSKVVFGEGGVQKVLGIGELNEHETKRLEEAKEALKKEIESGLQYAAANELES